MANNIPVSGGHDPQRLQTSLLAWYDRHRRGLPWRAAPGETADAYRVWLSEIMLQQTTVAVVERYFLEFTRRWPTVEALAAADLDDVLRAWAGLGYYARARNLHACAKVVAERLAGRFPSSERELLELPGIGAYTAGAIAAIAFDRPASAVDGNVERVVARLAALEAPLPEVKPQIRRIAAALVPQARAGDFAQALMDLGATICTPRKPNCLVCPWRDECAGRASGIAESLPRRRDRAARPERSGICFWVERGDGAVLLRRRPERGLLGGMLEVPSTPWAEGEDPGDPVRHAPVAADWRDSGAAVEHVFTHFRLTLSVWIAESPCVDGPLDPAFRWVPPENLAGEALPSVMRKVVAAARGSDALRPRRAAIRR